MMMVQVVGKGLVLDDIQQLLLIPQTGRVSAFVTLTQARLNLLSECCSLVVLSTSFGQENKIIQLSQCMDLQLLNSPRPLDIERALDLCLANQLPQTFNLSVSGNQLPSEQAQKINGMKRKMLLSELRLMISELIEMVRLNNSGIRKQLLKYEAESIVFSQSLISAFSQSSQQAEVERVSKKSTSSPKSSSLTIPAPQQYRKPLDPCQCYKNQDSPHSKQIQALKSDIEGYISQISNLKKENYRIYEENFSLEQKIRDYQKEIQVKNHKLLRKNSVIEREKEEIQQVVRTLQHTLQEREGRIQLLEGVVKKFKKCSSAKDEDEGGSSSGKRNVSHDEIVSIDSRHDNPLDKGFCSQNPSTYFRTQTNTQLKQSDILPRSIQRKRQLSSKPESRRTSPHRNNELRVPYETLTSNKSKNRKSLSKDKFNFQKIGMQLQNLSHELEKDLRRISHRIK